MNKEIQTGKSLEKSNLFKEKLIIAIKNSDARQKPSGFSDQGWCEN
jgi:hypothetical protein